MKRRLACMAAAVAMAAGAAMAGVESPTSHGEVAKIDTPIMRIPMVDKPPKIDGTMESGEWDEASAHSCFFYDYAQADFRFMAPMQTQLQIYACYDKDNLYIAYVSPVYPENSWLKAYGRFPDVIGHPTYGLQWDDHVEMEIRPVSDNVAGFRYGLFKWFINPIGTVCDQYWSQNRGPGMEWKSKAVVRSGVDAKKWILEIAIPLSEMVYGDYQGKDKNGAPIVSLPPPAESAFRCWFTRAIGGNGPFFNASDAHCWNTTKMMLIFDPQPVSFQVTELGPIMDDSVDVQLLVKNHDNRSQTLRLGFFVESEEGSIYSSYDSPELHDGLLEMVPGEVRKIHLKQPFPGISKDGDMLWFDVRSSGKPGKLVYRTRLIPFHSMDGGKAGGQSFRARRVENIAGMRPPRKDFQFSFDFSSYTKRLSAVLDVGLHGGSEDAKHAAEAKLTIAEAKGDEKILSETTVPVKNDFACFLVDLPKIEEGKSYKVSLLLFDRNKRIVGETSPEAFTCTTESWQHNQLGLNDGLWEPFTAIEAGPEGLDTLKHRFTPSPAGLPAQIFIKPDERDLPLEVRGPEAAKLPAKDLLSVGRGPQLRSPMRLDAVINGKRAPVEVVEPAKITRQWKSEVEYTAKLKAGNLPIELRTQYDCDGAMHVTMTYGGAGAVKIDALEMVTEVAGLVDLSVTSLYGGGMAGADKWECSLPTAEGVVWDSAQMERAELYYSHFVPWLWFGSADRAFTFYCDSDQNWMLDKDGSAMTLERNKAGEVTWRVKFVNHPVEIAAARTTNFTILTHPSKPKPKDARKLAWMYRGDTWAEGYMTEPADLDEAYLTGQWRTAAGAGKGVGDDQRTTFRKDGPPFHRYGRFRNQGIAAEMDQSFEDHGVFLLERQIRVGRRTGYWWDEYWPVSSSNNIAAGNAYIRDPNTVGDKELPWQRNFLTGHQRDAFKRLNRIWAANNVPQRNFLWANNSATLLESLAFDTQQVEECGAAHRSLDIDTVVQFPNSLDRYLSHNYTGLVSRISPDVIVAFGGDDKVYDRQYIGRALINDVGVTSNGPHGYFVHKEQAIRVLTLLTDFGLFDEKDVEKIPYWRNGDVLQYDTRKEPVRAYATVYRRPLGEGHKGVKTLIVLMNESDENVQFPLVISDAKKVFGGPDTLKASDVRGKANVPDALKAWWAKYAPRDADAKVLMDLETGDIVSPVAGKDGTFGPVFVGRHDFRILYGQCEEGK